MALKLTDEQLAIANTKAPKVIVRAGAGASKTTTLIQYALANPKEKILYLAYNKAIKDEAEGRFPPNVVIKTSHGAAMAEVGRYYAHKLTDNLRPQTVMDALKLETRVMLSRPILARYAKKIADTMNAYLVSADEEISVDHVSINMADPIERQNFKPYDLVMFAKEVWDRMTNPEDTGIPMLHDGYLKIFMLEKLSLGNFDRILFDEGQDANPVTLQILINQDAPFVLVGDNNQSIYAFRGAIDALQQFADATEYRLSGSFRFGSNIAMEANKILYLKDNRDFIRGIGGEDEVIYQEREGIWRRMLNPDDKFMYISRGAFNLFGEAITQAKAGKKIYFYGDIKSYRFSRLNEVYKLWSGERPNDVFLQRFEDFEELMGYAQNDYDMEACCRLVEHYEKQLPAMVRQVKAATVEREEDATVLFSTAHKSKGLEADIVVLAEDFKGFSEGLYFSSTKTPLPVVTPSDIEEANIAYVAITRAKKKLFMPFSANAINHQIDKRALIAKIAASVHAGEIDNSAVAQHLANRKVRML